jgi:hypothetical protein
MIADQVPAIGNGFHDVRICRSSLADTEEGGRYPTLLQDLEHLGSHLGIRAVVESERYAAGRDIRRRELAEIGSQKARARCQAGTQD